jgi:acylphosphatase
MVVARRFVVSGAVQGVGFRYFATRAAEAHSVRGTVKNLADGTVEAVVEGEPASVDAFREALERGPSHGRVDRVAEEETSVIGYESFRVVY